MASQLFESLPEVDRITRARLVERVINGWKAWHNETGGAPEQYLAHLQTNDVQGWRDAQWYVGLAIMLPLGRVEFVGMKRTITVAPVTEKALPGFLKDTWERAASALSLAETWIVVGYSLPEYDLLVRHLLVSSASKRTNLYVVDPNDNVCNCFRQLLPNSSVVGFPGLPDGLVNLGAMLSGLKV